MILFPFIGGLIQRKGKWMKLMLGRLSMLSIIEEMPKSGQTHRITEQPYVKVK